MCTHTHTHTLQAATREWAKDAQQQQQLLLLLLLTTSTRRKKGIPRPARTEGKGVPFVFLVSSSNSHSERHILEERERGKRGKRFYFWGRQNPPNHQRWHAKWKLSRNMYMLSSTFFARLRADLYAQSVLSNKISASELRRKLSKSTLLVGYPSFSKEIGGVSKKDGGGEKESLVKN